MDRFGLIPLGALAVGVGAFLFATGNYSMASIGRFLQGAGGAVPLFGAVYIISKYFPSTKAATLIGAAQMFGMAGGFAGQFAVGPLIGIVSGAGMIPYTVIKEANPSQFSGTATGLANFINFTFSALLGQVFGWLLVSVSHDSALLMMKDYRLTFGPLIFGVALAVILTLFLKETGHSALKKH